MRNMHLLLYCIFLYHNYIYAKTDPPYVVSDDAGLGRRFDGIGGLSGGGPNFGASLQILKVEIGGDDQSTDGTEASHMHEEWDENYNRGYEWWLMKEAKKRNPDIKLWGLSWTWPNFIGDTDGNPYKNLTTTAIYTVKWILGAKEYHNLTIDYIGIWNEQYCNFDYVVELRKTLDEYELQNVQIVACDGWVGDMYRWMQNKSMVDSVYAFGVHYPGTYTPVEAIQTNLTMWSSEDYSTKDDDTGAGCWARILNQNYVNGYMTSTTAWNLIASYYPGLPYEYDGLMNAVEPWSGYYEVKNPIWITAHTTQFTKIGYRYLPHDYGVGKLNYNGSYVSLTSKDRKNLTIVIETFSHNHSICIRPDLPPYDIKPQKAVFKFGGSFAQLSQMHLWRTKLDFENPNNSIVFHYEGKIEISAAKLSIILDVDSVYTLSSTKIGTKGDAGSIPSSEPFPLPYFDDFQNYQINQEPYHLAPQSGVWEIYAENDGNKFARQTILNRPVTWCGEALPGPAAVIGDVNWDNVAASAKVRIPSVNGTKEIFIGLRVYPGGCDIGSANGTFFWITAKSNGYAVTTDLAGVHMIDVGLFESQKPIEFDKWYNVTVSIQGNKFTAKLDDVTITQVQVDDHDFAKKSGFVALGTDRFGYADYDDLTISSA